MRIINDPGSYLLEFQKISSVTEFWMWLENPFRAAVLGLRNGTASSSEDVNVSFAQNFSSNSNLVLRHNLVFGRVRMRQIRSNVRECVKAEILDVFQAPCISDFKSENLDKGIETTSDCMSRGRQKYECIVTIDDNGAVPYEVLAVERSGYFTLSHGGSILKNVPSI